MLCRCPREGCATAGECEPAGAYCGNGDGVAVVPRLLFGLRWGDPPAIEDSGRIPAAEGIVRAGGAT